MASMQLMRSQKLTGCPNRHNLGMSGRIFCRDDRIDTRRDDLIAFDDDRSERTAASGSDVVEGQIDRLVHPLFVFILHTLAARPSAV